MLIFMTLSKALSVARSLISDGPVTVLRMGFLGILKPYGNLRA